MIKKAIKKYQETKNTLRVYKASLAEQEKEVAVWLHDNYEQIAKGENWNTQESCKVDFDNLPKENKNVMLELAKRILN